MSVVNPVNTTMVDFVLLENNEDAVISLYPLLTRMNTFLCLHV